MMLLGDSDSESLRRLCLSWQPGSVFEELTKANCFQVLMCPLAKGFSFSSYRSLHRVSPDMVVGFPKRVVRVGGGERKERKEKRWGRGGESPGEKL